MPVSFDVADDGQSPVIDGFPSMDKGGAMWILL